MGDILPKPEDRLSYMLPPPPGVSCNFKSWALRRPKSDR